MTEAENSNKEQFGEDRLADALLRHRENPVDKVVQNIKEEVHEWIGRAPLYDDITLVLFKEK